MSKIKLELCKKPKKRTLEKALEAQETLLNKTGAGSEFTGWIDWPVNYDRDEFERLKNTAEHIKRTYDVMVVIGVGGSYLGSRCAIEGMKRPGKKGTRIMYIGNALSGDSYFGKLAELEDKEWCINVISKSGTTTEPAIAFRVFKKVLEDRYGKEEANRRIYATTDREKGAIKSMANEAGWECFTVPDDIGGRYSVLTSVGMLPIAVAGYNVDAMMLGAQKMRERLLGAKDNDAVKYAAIRYEMMQEGKKVELLANFDPKLHMVAEWWKQLFGESEGKEGKGLFPASVDYTRDLHSMGQYVQEGQRMFFETFISIAKTWHDVYVEYDVKNEDGLNYLTGLSINEINRIAMEGSILAHKAGNVPVNVLTLPLKDEVSFGEMFYFFMYTCGVSGYMNGVNPFDQPGVELYKKNMFHLLGKPGYEEI